MSNKANKYQWIEEIIENIDALFDKTKSKLTVSFFYILLIQRHNDSQLKQGHIYQGIYGPD